MDAVTSQLLLLCLPHMMDYSLEPKHTFLLRLLLLGSFVKATGKATKALG